MLNHGKLSALGMSLWLIGTSACGGADTKKPESPVPAKKSEQAATEGSKAGEASAKPESKPSAKSKAEPASEPTTKRTPKDIITAPDVVFVLAFAKSEVGEEAQQTCAKKSKDNDKKQRACMEKERKKVTSDVVSFSKDKHGKWWWMTARMQGNKLSYLHKVAIEFGEEKSDSISIKPRGKDKGKKPWKQVPDQLTVSVPDEFSIVLKDPTYGKMVFEAKIGIAGGEG